MRWSRDPTGRFPERPYYLQEELDSLSEGWVVSFLRERHGAAEFPVSTEDLTVMIESDTSDLDQYADLSSEGGKAKRCRDSPFSTLTKSPW